MSRCIAEFEHCKLYQDDHGDDELVYGVFDERNICLFQSVSLRRAYEHAEYFSVVFRRETELVANTRIFDWNDAGTDPGFNPA